MARKEIKKILNNINASYLICDHLIGEHHKLWHRLTIGTIIILLGTLLIVIDNTFWTRIITHSTGAVIEAIGIVPWLELILKEKNNINNI